MLVLIDFFIGYFGEVVGATPFNAMVSYVIDHVRCEADTVRITELR